MELFFAGVPSINILVRFYELTGIRVNILKSYYELQDNDFKKEILSYKPYVDKIMLDSGAFSANNSVKPNEAEAIKQRYPIFLRANSEFINEFIYRVFSYDYRFDQEGFTDNFTMFVNLHNVYKSICPVIHTFTMNGSNPEVTEYSKFKAPTMAIGQIVNVETDSRIDRTSATNRKYLQATINSIKEANSDCHLFGIMNYEALKELKNYDSCDSTSWNTYARTGTVIIFWDWGPSSGKTFYGNYYFPQHQKTTNKTKPFDELSKHLRDRFFYDMKKHLKLDKYDFYNTRATTSLELANLYNSIKYAEYINSNTQPYIPSPNLNLNTQNISKTKPIEQDNNEEDSIESFISELLELNPFASPNKKQDVQEVVDNSGPEINPFEIPEHKNISQELVNPIPKENPFSTAKKEEKEIPLSNQRQNENPFE